MSSELTKKQKGFIKDFIKTGNATESALNNYDIESDDPINVAGNIGCTNIRKPKIKAELSNFINDLERHRNKILKRMEATVDEAEYNELSQSLDRVIKNQQLLSGKITERQEIQINIDANSNSRYADKSEKQTPGNNEL